MASIRDMNMRQLNSTDWKTMSFEPETLKNHPNIIQKILKTYPNQVANFCVYQLDLEVIRCIGVENVMKLIKRAGIQILKRKDPLTQDMMIEEFQYPKEFLTEFKSVLDMSKLYTQECADVDMLSSNIKDLDIVYTIVYNAKNNDKNYDFIKKCKNHIIEAMISDYNSCAVSFQYLKNCGMDYDFSRLNKFETRHKKITKEIAKEIETYYNMHVPVEFIGNSIEEIAFKMNTNIIPSKYITLCTVNNYLRDCDE